jgi:inosine-uridine nucleoside N-ribohydrolase
LAKAISRDPAIIPMFDRVILTGGSVSGLGDVTPAAEFNMHLDPQAAKVVFQSATTKSLIPFEICNRLKFGWELIDFLPSKHTRVGAVMHEILPHLFRTARQLLGQETIALQAILPILLIAEPILFEFEEMAGDVEVAGELTSGATVFDRRIPRTWRSNMEVASAIDAEAARDAFYNMLKFAAQQ